MKNKYYILIIIAMILLITIGGVIFFNTRPKEESDAIKFSKEYTSVPVENVFVYRDSSEIIKILENGTGVVYLGFPECPWCQTYAVILNEVANEVGLDKIYYYDILEDRKNNTEEYQTMVSLLKDYLQFDEEGNKRIFVPNVSFHVNGEVIGNDNETSLDTGGFDDPNEYWTEDKKQALKDKLTILMENVLKASNVCTDCNK